MQPICKLLNHCVLALGALASITSLQLSVQAADNANSKRLEVCVATS